jgi:hypothetical protein
MNEADLVVDYIPNPKPGQVVLSDGRVCDRTKVVFLLREDHRDKTILYATDRAYKKEGGTFPDPIVKMPWPYAKPGSPSPKARRNLPASVVSTTR